MTTLQVRIDEKTKKNAKKVFDKVGLDMSTAIKVYLHQVVITQGIPFPLLTENGFTAQQELAILQASEEAKHGINVTKTKNWKETQAHLNQLKKPDLKKDQFQDALHTAAGSWKKAHHPLSTAKFIRSLRASKRV